MMRTICFISIAIFGSFSAKVRGQNCVPTGINGTVITTPCTETCRDLFFQVPDLRSSADYTVISVPYAPFPYVTPGATTDDRLYDDDTYSSIFDLPFPFCFYDSVYRRAIVSSNGLITFDTAYAYCGPGQAGYSIGLPIPAAPGLNSCSSDHYPRSSIMGVFMDLDPRPGPTSPVVSSPPERKIEWRVEGVFPCRRFVVSFYRVGVYEAIPCGLRSPATFQIVIYESTGVIDVFIENKNCDALGPAGSRAILGVQDQTRTKGKAAPGKNATASWTASQEGYRFVPSGGSSRFIRSELLNMDFSPVATATVSRTTPGLLDLNFSNICTSEPEKQYLLRTTFAACDDPNTLLTGLDTITIKKDIPDFAVTTTTTATICKGDLNGTLQAIPGSGSAPYQFTLSPGNQLQSGNSAVYNGLAGGDYLLTVKDASGCSANPIPVTVAEGPVRTKVWVNPFDTIVYAGDKFQLNAIASNPDATVFSWSPSAGLSDPTIAVPVVTAGDAGAVVKYRVVASTIPGCKGDGFVTVRVYKGPDIYVPTAFTPNNDGVNDLFLPVPVGIKQYSYFRVYNRWGNLVFSTTQMDKGWDGTFQGNPMPPGSFIWMIEGWTKDNCPITKKGVVTIIR
ncbi:MAG: gliding motility-associated C-terminal domain-containing protein [Bacteroidetes bacterium]|nr:gliding motility-associated C-terminal domain-containing protein [Bacteroidota bacterium]